MKLGDFSKEHKPFFLLSIHSLLEQKDFACKQNISIIKI